jgi:SAM-dependent methyltransferase
VGFDDSAAIASRLPRHLRYINSHLHEFPKLDLCNPPEETIGFFEFAICSEVLEHVTGDPQIAFNGLQRILRPGGFAVVTVPVAVSHEEWYPNLRETLEVREGFVRWVDTAGNEHVKTDPEFHGGTGDVLAHRVFSKESLIQGLRLAGFKTFENLGSNGALGVGEIPSDGLIVAYK